MNVGPQLPALLSLTSGAGLLMVVFGTKKRMLRWRFERRRCPSCRRYLDECSCSR